MKKYYSFFRIMLRTFYIGLLSVLLFQNWFEDKEEIEVNLPTTQSKSPIIIMPEDKISWTKGGGSGPDESHKQAEERQPPELKEEFKRHKKYNKFRK